MVYWLIGLLNGWLVSWLVCINHSFRTNWLFFFMMINDDDDPVVVVVGIGGGGGGGLLLQQRKITLF